MISFVLSALLAASAVQAGKRGVAWPWYNQPLDPGVLNNGQGQVVAIYDWETYPPPTFKNNLGGYGWIGMQGCWDCQSSPLNQLQNRWRQYGWSTVFSVNEPDHPATYHSPADTANWYKTNINPLSIKKALPAITSDTSAGRGLDWLQQMVNACAGGCYADYINLHWYGQNFAQFQAHVTNAHNRFPQYGVIISEFALQNPSGGQAAQVDFFRQAFAWLDSQSWVILYFPFVATSPSLLRANGNGAADFVGTGSCLYTDAGGPSAVGNLMY
ncbi:glycoside hydrolase family 128 protein [Atractiella rhizophila]|nr:glycoside hydrolase family 128 protein [Atractiella rhizophila]